MSRHTPGPWRYRKNRLDRFCVETDGGATITAQVIAGGVSNGEANARLIAAAPELLEALHNCVNLLREVHSMLDAEKIGNETLEDWLKEAKDAIAKAQG